jgi:hypothetical protein
MDVRSRSTVVVPLLAAAVLVALAVVTHRAAVLLWTGALVLSGLAVVAAYRQQRGGQVRRLPVVVAVFVVAAGLGVVATLSASGS